MKYVVTGSTSFIGVELCRQLLNAGNEVMAVVRPGSAGITKLPKSDHLYTVLSDMRDYRLLDRQIPKAEVFINLAWQGTGHEGRNVYDIQSENIRFSEDALHAAARMGCSLFVESGSQAEYGTVLERISEYTPEHPFSEYGRAKLHMKELGFRLTDQLRIKYLHLRIFSLFGETDHPWTLVMSSIDKMLRNESIDLSSCTQKWNFLYVVDACKQIRLLTEKAIQLADYRHEVFNIASEDTRLLRDFVERMRDLTGSKSCLNYGVYTPANTVTLDPDVAKSNRYIGFINDYTFDEVVNKIIESKKNKDD